MSRVREQEKRGGRFVGAAKTSKELAKCLSSLSSLEPVFCSLWGPLFSPHALDRFDCLPPPYDLVIWTNDSVSFSFDKGRSGVLTNCSLCGTEAALFFGSDVQVFFAEACGKIADEKRVKYRAKNLAKHLGGLDRNDFYNFDKPRKRACQKRKMESSEQSKVGDQPK